MTKFSECQRNRSEFIIYSAFASNSSASFVKPVVAGSAMMVTLGRFCISGV